MSLPHSGNPEHESELMKLFRRQQDGTKQRAWPEGRVSGDDDGELVYKIGTDESGENVLLDFGKPVTWVGMPPVQAVKLAQMLIQHARSISKEPIRIVLN